MDHYFSLMRKILIVLVFLPSILFSQVPWKQLGVDIDGDTALDELGHAVSMNAAGDRIAIGVPFNDSIGTNGGLVKVFQYNGTVWVQLGDDILGEAAGDKSGYSVSLNAAGNRVAIGAPDAKGTLSITYGHARIFQYNATASSWTQLGADIDGESANDQFGEAVAMNAAGDRVAIGGPTNDGNGTNSGHVRIYRYTGTAWTQLGSDIDGEAANNNSGSAVAINAVGDRVAIGAPNNTSDKGHVRVYTYNSTSSSWSQLGSDIDGEFTGDKSGSSVAMNASGSRVAIGAPLNKGGTGGVFGTFTGQVRVYDYGTAWTQVGSDIDGEDARDKAGTSVALDSSGNRLAIGAPYNDGTGFNPSIGHVRLYAYGGTSWAQVGTDIDGEAADDFSGWTVATDAKGERIAIGGPVNDGNGFNAGHVRVYKECPVVYGTDSIVACGSLTWIDGNTYTTNNSTATHMVASANGCDSVVSLNLTILPHATGIDVRNVCDSLIWVDGNTYATDNNTATHAYTGAAANGCDSIVTLNLTIGSVRSVDTQSACDSLNWIDGNTYTANNFTATHTLSGAAANGCDSIVTLNLTITRSATTDSQIACDSMTWIDGVTYTSNNFTATHTLTNKHGCDSVVTLNLTVHHSINATDSITSCDSLTWIDGNTYTGNNTSAFHTISGVAAHGCDSIINLNLTVYQSTNGTDTQSACRSFTWIDGNTYTANNNTAVYTLIGANSRGCDSTVTLNLTIDTVNDGATSNGSTLTASDSGASYQWLDCNKDFSPIPGATSKTYVATTNGRYAVQVMRNSCKDTSICIPVRTVGLLAHDADNFMEVFPNPTRGKLTVVLDQLYADVDLKLWAVNGSGVLRELHYEATKEVHLDLVVPVGMYFLEVVTSNGQHEVVRVVME